MHYRLYCSSGNSEGIDEYVGYVELDTEGSALRYLEISSATGARRYDEARSADAFGMLPEGQWPLDNPSSSTFGVESAISRELFEAVWLTTQCLNDSGDP